MRICTWNVDGLNGRVEQVVQWIHDNQPDIVGLQEAGTRDPESVVSAFQSEGYRCKLHMKPDDKSPKQGVAILSRHPLEVTQVDLPGQEPRGARLLTASTAGLSFTTVCVPSAYGKAGIEGNSSGSTRSASTSANEKPTMGPPSCAGTSISAPSPLTPIIIGKTQGERTRTKPGFRKDERLQISSLLEAGWFDLVRELNPDERIFTYWHSPDLYNDDKGLRIDLVFGNAAVVRRLQSARIDRGHYADRGRTGKPDHAPVVVDLA